MKISSAVTEYVKVQLSTNPAWAQRAIVKLWERQTADEQAAQTTGHDNGIGFNGTDAFILSSFAEQINKGRTLSPKQLTKNLFFYINIFTIHRQRGTVFQNISLTI